MYHAVIMAGGSGTRFWPESRSHRPKQFLKIAGDEAMITLTARRLLPVVPKERIYVVTNVTQQAQARSCLGPLGVPEHNVIAEPSMRNTAACVGLAARCLVASDPDAVFAVLPADHIIEPRERFCASLEKAMRVASEGGLITFGIRPTFPATGYGYIQLGDPLDDDQDFPMHSIASFKEKPSRPVAEKFLEDGGYAWNSGMFVWRAEEILSEISEHCPELYRGLDRLDIDDDAETWNRIDEVAYASLPSLPIDTAVMERSAQGRTIQVDYVWNDVGSWAALHDLHAKRDDGNWAIFPDGGDLMAIDAKNVLGFSSSKHVVAVIGINDVVVIHSDGATLVAPRDRCEDVKQIVNALKDRNDREFL